MEIALATICDEARERPDGKLDLVGVFNELRAPGFPALQDRMTVVLTIAWNDGESGRMPIRADLIDEDEQLILTIQGHTDVPPAEAGVWPHTRIVMPLENVVFPHPGRYWFRMSAGEAVRPACYLYIGKGTA